ncbi:uncharacterized protein LOC143251524 isoform X2 [Tachypleus tridentatus]
MLFFSPILKFEKKILDVAERRRKVYPQKQLQDNFIIRFFSDGAVRQQWLKNVSREIFQSSRHHRVCNEQFWAKDYTRGVHPRDIKEYDILKYEPLAMPTIFPDHPLHKQVVKSQSRPPPRKRAPEIKETCPVAAKKKKRHQVSSIHIVQLSQWKISLKQ